MKIKDLIAQLQTMPPDAEVMVLRGDEEAYVYTETVELKVLWRDAKRIQSIYEKQPVDTKGQPWDGIVPFQAVIIQ